MTSGHVAEVHRNKKAKSCQCRGYAYVVDEEILLAVCEVYTFIYLPKQLIQVVDHRDWDRVTGEARGAFVKLVMAVRILQ